MDVQAWCGHCGESFRLAELTEAGFTGRCPRCGADLAPGYTPVAVGAVGEVAAAAATLVGALSRLHDVAPHLHVDVRKLRTDIDAAAEQ